MPLTSLQPSQVDPSFAGYMFRNRLHNGAMMIDQKNAGASITPVSGQTLVDRWLYSATQTGKLASQQQVSPTAGPSGFPYYLYMVSQSAYSVTATDSFIVGQGIEGYTAADLMWGTANAKTVTLSFVVYSSLTGTFGGAVKVYGGTYSYPFTYSIPVANTWTTISVTIPGPTAGTWPTGANGSIYVGFSLGAGSSVSAAAGTWAATSAVSATGAVSVVGTSGAIWALTGVQLEAGAVATPFENRQYPEELRLCQRYAMVYSSLPLGTAINANWTSGTLISFPSPMRTAPVLSAGAAFTATAGSAGTPSITLGGLAASAFGIAVGNSATNWTTGAQVSFSGTLSAEI